MKRGVFKQTQLFACDVDKAKLLLRLDTFSHGRVCINPCTTVRQSQNHTHMTTFLNYWGLWVEVEDKEAEQERVVESLRNHISLPPKYQLFSQEKRFCCGNVTIKSLKVQLLPNSRLLGSSCQDYNRAHLSRIVSEFLLALHFPLEHRVGAQKI